MLYIFVKRNVEMRNNISVVGSPFSIVSLNKYTILAYELPEIVEIFRKYELNK